MERRAIASKLERMVQPGEQVLFQTRRSYRLAACFVLGSSFVFGLVGLLIAVIHGTSSTGISLALSGAGGSLAAFIGAGAEAVLTDMRLLYRRGPFRRVVDVPLWHIAKLDHIKDLVALRDRAGETLRLAHLPDAEDLGKALMAATGLPGPIEGEGRLKGWQENGYSNAIALCTLLLTTAGFAAMAAVMLLTDWQSLVDGISGSGQSGSRGLTLVLLPTAFIALTAAELAGGALLGAYGFAVAMRLRLSAAEARQVFDFATQAPTTLHPLQRLWRRPLGPARRLAARLYGEPV